MTGKSGYLVLREGDGVHVGYVADGAWVTLFGPYSEPEEAWAAIPDRTKPPGLPPNERFFRERGAFAGCTPGQLAAMGVEKTTPREVGETSHIAHDNISELAAAELRDRIYAWLSEQPAGATADAINAAFPDPANRADKQIATMRRAGMITYLVENGERVKRDTRMDRPAYVHVAVPPGDWKPVVPVRVTAGATNDAAERLERMKSTGMSMVPSLRKLRDAVQTRSIGANALSVELTGITDWLETLFKEEMEYGQ